MRIAIIGAGGIADRGYFPILVKRPDVEIVNLFSRTQATLDKARAKWAFEHCTTDMQSVIDSQPQAAFVLTSNESHYEICKLLLKNGIDIYVEKPLTIYSTQAHDLARIAEEHQRIIMVGFNRRYALLYRQAKEIFGDRPIRSAIIQKHRPQASLPSLFKHYIDDTIHQIDLMRFLCGDVQPLNTHYEMENGLLVGAVSTSRMSSGGIATLVVSHEAGAWQECVSLHGDGLSVHVDAFREMRIKHDSHEEVYGNDRAGNWITSLQERGFADEIEHFLQCVANRETPFTNIREAIKTQELLEELVKASGDPLDIPPAA